MFAAIASAKAPAVIWQDGTVTEVTKEDNGRLSTKDITYTIRCGAKTIYMIERSMEMHGFKPERFKIGDPIHFSVRPRWVVKYIDHAGKERHFMLTREPLP